MSHSRRSRSSRAPFVFRSALGLFAILAVLASPSTAAAHAELETIAPADQSSGPSPTEIVATFAENLDPAKSSFTVVDASGTVVAKGGEVGSDPRTMTLALTTPLAPGSYTIRWATFSTEDGETDRGTTTFTVVAAPSPSATPAPSVVASVAPSASPSAAPSLAQLPSASAAPATPTTSTSDAIIPIVAALIVLAAIGLWLLRGRGRTAR